MVVSNGRNIGKNPALPSGRLFGHCGKIGKIFKNNIFFRLKFFFILIFWYKNSFKKKKLLKSSGRIFKSLPQKKKLQKKRKKRSLFLTLIVNDYKNINFRLTLNIISV